MENYVKVFIQDFGFYSTLGAIVVNLLLLRLGWGLSFIHRVIGLLWVLSGFCFVIALGVSPGKESLFRPFSSGLSILWWGYNVVYFNYLHPEIIRLVYRRLRETGRKAPDMPTALIAAGFTLAVLVLLTSVFISKVDLLARVEKVRLHETLKTKAEVKTEVDSVKQEVRQLAGKEADNMTDAEIVAAIAESDQAKTAYVRSLERQNRALRREVVYYRRKNGIRSLSIQSLTPAARPLPPPALPAVVAPLYTEKHPTKRRPKQP